MVFTKKIWDRVNNFLLSIEDLNRIENGIYEALSKIENLNSSQQVIGGLVTLTGFVINYNPYGSNFNDDLYSAAYHINFEDYIESSFSELPSVVVTPITSSPSTVFVSVVNVTKTGFDIFVRRNANWNTGVFWQATGNV